MNRKKLIRYEVAFAVCLVAAFVAYKGWNKVIQPPSPAVTLEHNAQATPAAASPGFLWDREPGSSPVIQINPDTFSRSATWKAGEQVSLVYSPNFPPLVANVAHASKDAGGTRVSHLAIEGQPPGELMLMEHPEQNFFVCQLTYPGHATAYEFRKSGNEMIGERKQLEQLVCANDSNRGLPPMNPQEAPAVPYISVAPATALEGGKGTFVVALSTPTTATVKVSYQVVAGSADAGDFRSRTGILTIRPRAIRAKISIASVKDTLVEADEQFTLLLSNPINALLQEDSAVATIIDNDSPPSLRVFPAKTNEGTIGTSNLAFTVWLGKPAATDVTVDYATADDSAKAGSDFVDTSGTLTIRRGRKSAIVYVPVLCDSQVEEDETFTFRLSNPQGADLTIATATGTIANDDTLQIAEVSPVPKFTSKPGVPSVVYLDFDGHTCSGTAWKGGGTVTAAGIYDVLGEAGVKDVWERFVEAFAPFNLNITTDENYFLAASPGRRIRCVVTPSNEWYSNSAGGVAYVGSFKYTNDSPVWVFSDNLGNSSKFIAIAGIHEVGHSMGLEHDGSSGDGAYYRGHGSGETSWAPVMGYGLYRNVVQWSRGEYYQANQRQDDTTIIAANPGVGHAPDEDDNTAATARPLGKSVQGVISTANDVDVFQFATRGGDVSIQAYGTGNSTKLDILLEVRNSSNAVVASANPPNTLDAEIPVNLPAGSYTVHVSGTGTGTPMASTPTGFSDYGSLGQYLIQSAIP